MKRCVIFFFYDKDGIVDRYILNILKDLQHCCDKMLFVCNGKLCSKSRHALDSYVSDILVRDNTGFDVWAYREGLLYLGWQTLASYDELVLMNFTIFPTLHSFSEMFIEMESIETDFWGATKYFESDTAVAGHVPDHIQSHFIAVRQSMHTSYEFRHYWETIPAIHSYQESVRLHESRFTRLFESYGFRSYVYADAEELRPLTDCPVQWRQQYLIEHTKTPFVKRKTFFYPPYDGIIIKTAGEAASDTFRYFKKNKNYDIESIWENILRTSSMTDIKNALHLNYILPSSAVFDQSPEDCKIGVLLHVDCCVCAEQFKSYLNNIPHNAEIHLFADDEATDDFSKILSGYQLVRHSREEGETFGLTDVLGHCAQDCRYLLFFRFHVQNRSDYAAAYKGMECLLKSRSFIENVFRTFELEPRLGMLFPSPPNNDRFTATMGREWSGMEKEIIAAAQRLGVMIDDRQPVVAPYMGMGWCRADMVKKILEWCPLSRQTARKGSFRFWDVLSVLLAQKAGYYSGWLFSTEFAEIEITNLYFYINKLLLAFDSDAEKTIWQITSNIKHRKLSEEDCSIVPTRVLRNELISRIVPKSISRFLGVKG